MEKNNSASTIIQQQRHTINGNIVDYIKHLKEQSQKEEEKPQFQIRHSSPTEQLAKMSGLHYRFQSDENIALKESQTIRQKKLVIVKLVAIGILLIFGVTLLLKWNLSYKIFNTSQNQVQNNPQFNKTNIENSFNNKTYESIHNNVYRKVIKKQQMEQLSEFFYKLWIFQKHGYVECDHLKEQLQQSYNENFQIIWPIVNERLKLFGISEMKNTKTKVWTLSDNSK